MNNKSDQIIRAHCGSIEDRLAACRDEKVAEQLKQNICYELKRRVNDVSLLKNIESYIDNLIKIRFFNSSDKTINVKRISKNIPIEALITQHPFSVHLLMRRGIKCIVCGEPIWGTLEDAAKEKGISDLELDRIVEEINQQI